MIKIYEKGKWSKISDSFFSIQFDCKCRHRNCKKTYIDSDLIDYLEKKQKKIGTQFTIICGFQCTASVGASYHSIGRAVVLLDIGGLAKHFKDVKGMLRSVPGNKKLYIDLSGVKTREFINESLL